MMPSLAASSLAFLLVATTTTTTTLFTQAFFLPATPTTPTTTPTTPTTTTKSSLLPRQVGNVNFDFYPGLRGVFEMGNIILDEMRAGTQEAGQEVSEIADWVSSKVSVVPPAGGEKREVVVHPLYGELVKDLVYKQIYCTSVQKLASIPIWEQQRIYRPERAKLLCQDIKNKLKEGMPLTLPGVITVYEMDGGAKTGLLDGQHRAGALKMLMDEDVLYAEAHLILIEVFPVQKEEDIKRLFTEINTAQPVSIIDMPDMADATEKEIITQACEALRLEFGAMFKVSGNCRLPHVNIDNLRDTLFKANVVGRTGAGNAEQLVEWVKTRNELLAKRANDAWIDAYRGRNAETITKAVDKARANQFFLGMEPNWMDVAEN